MSWLSLTNFLNGHQRFFCKLVNALIIRIVSNIDFFLIFFLLHLKLKTCIELSNLVFIHINCLILFIVFFILSILKLGLIMYTFLQNSMTLIRHIHCYHQDSHIAIRMYFYCFNFASGYPTLLCILCQRKRRILPPKWT